jgi:hypothetical protein
MTTQGIRRANMTLETDFLTEDVVARFLDYWRDAGNWSGEPLVGGNVGGDAADKGYLVNMKKAGLITTVTTCDRINGVIRQDTWVVFTPKGVELARSLE